MMTPGLQNRQPHQGPILFLTDAVLYFVEGYLRAGSELEEDLQGAKAVSLVSTSCCT